MVSDSVREDLSAVLAEALDGRRLVLVLGIGNDLRGDDGVGSLIARDLAVAALPSLPAFDAGIAVENATGALRKAGAQTVLLVDAVRVADRPLGDWRLYPTDALDTYCHTTHSLPLSLLIETWRQLVPGLTFHFLGVNIGETSDFAPLSPEVASARAEVAAVLTETVKSLSGKELSREADLRLCTRST